MRPYSQVIEDIVLREGELHISIHVLDEAVFTITRAAAWTELGIRRIEKLREYVRKHGYEFFEKDVNELHKFLEEENIAVVEDKATPQELIEIAKRFHLLPADTLIALTC